jgi:trehalose 6-phosphate synthase
MSRLVVVSNRVATTEGVTSGGLAVALRSGLAGDPALWFGWSGERVAAYTGDVTQRRVGDLDVATVDLEEADYEAYYNGYSNGALWPLFHSRTDLADYERAFAEGYRRVNRRFAEALAPLLQPGDLIWVHDYHLIPLGAELRRLGVEAPIGFFLHIPWPARQLFATLPRHRDLAEALFAYDLVGMQTDDDVEAFDSYALHEAGGVRDGDRVEAFGRSTIVRAFPIGLDTDNFLALSRSDEAIRACDRMTAHGLFRSLIVGVDRLDYSKGIPERLLGFEQYLRDHPDMVRKVLYLQIAPSSRGEVEAYQTLRANVLALAGRINATWAEMDHAPMLCVNRNYARAELAGIYRAAKVGLVTPLRDGMNLVAKEYVAAQDPSDPGVLILSRFAGASRQMKDALIVNPYSPEELADALASAIAMPREERIRRWDSLMAGVVRDDVGAWKDSFVAALKVARDSGASEGERPRRATPAFGQLSADPLGPSPLRLGPRLSADTAFSAAGWRPTAPG